jgi:cytochrome oxidase assembly protein ShyY1
LYRDIPGKVKEKNQHYQVKKSSKKGVHNSSDPSKMALIYNLSDVNCNREQPYSIEDHTQEYTTIIQIYVYNSRVPTQIDWKHSRFSHHFMTALQIGNVNVEELANNHVQYINIIC